MLSDIFSHRQGLTHPHISFQSLVIQSRQALADCPFAQNPRLTPRRYYTLHLNIMALRVLATEAVSSLGLRRAVPALSSAQPQFLQVFSQNFASGKHYLLADLSICAIRHSVRLGQMLPQLQRIWFIKIAMSGRRLRAKQPPSASPTLPRSVQLAVRCVSATFEP